MGVTPGIDGDARERLRDFLTKAAEGAVTITDFRKLPGGAVQENWLLDITVSDGEWAGEHELVLRRDAAVPVAASHRRGEEFQILKLAHEAGVMVPKPCLMCEDAAVIGGPFFIMHRVGGEAAGHRLVKRPVNEALAAELGTQLARIHAITPGVRSLRFLKRPKLSPALRAVADYRCYLDDLGASRPALEWGLRWLELRAPERGAIVLCHRDYRTGNYMVSDNGELTGILDWEFAGWGEPEEDLAWFCARCWRFGADEREAGGIASRESFYKAYEKEAGRWIDEDRVAFWEVMAHVRWAVIACQQAARHVSGGEQSLELALTAHVVPELELEVLALTGALKGEAA
ncbi:MAG: phosphotransferase family protein [Proteobacteria bacterium]|nr:phosphotransferase family protein [Pseudomonadota bacterium]